MIAGLLLTVALYRADLASLLPGAWLLLYGAAVTNAGAFSVRVVPAMGICFTGMASCVMFQSPLSASPRYSLSRYSGRGQG